jgi:hypothetical protein
MRQRCTFDVPFFLLQPDGHLPQRFRQFEILGGQCRLDLIQSQLVFTHQFRFGSVDLAGGSIFGVAGCKSAWECVLESHILYGFVHLLPRALCSGPESPLAWHRQQIEPILSVAVGEVELAQNQLLVSPAFARIGAVVEPGALLGQ